jgi:molybdate transport system regulatory protein
MAISGPLKLNFQLMGADGPAIGPGKAMVLEAIEQAGSISGAGRLIGMSYRRTWLLVEALNKDWRERVVETRPGRGKEGGAQLTPFGSALLSDYRAIEGRMMAAADGEDLQRLIEARKGED